MATQAHKLKSSAVFIITLTVVGLLAVSPGISFADKYVIHTYLPWSVGNNHGYTTHLYNRAMNNYMGFETELDPTPSSPVGALITHVSPGSRADKAGILSGDIIKSVNGMTVIDSDNLANNVDELFRPNPLGQLMIFTCVLIRDGVTKSVNMKVGDLENISK